jgi:hypothetical protein
MNPSHRQSDLCLDARLDQLRDLDGVACHDFHAGSGWEALGC